jgi:hypothetical protein
MQVAGSAVSAKGTTPRAAKEKAYVLRQTNTYFGPVTLYIADDGAKFAVDNGEMFVMCAAPDWKIMMFRPDSKHGMCTTLEDWSKHGFGIMNPRVPLSRGQQSKSVAGDLKVPCHVVTAQTGKRLWATNDPLVFRQSTKVDIKKVTYKCTDGIVLRPEIRAFLSGMYSVHDFGGIPLELRYDLSSGSVDQVYHTVSLKQDNVPKSVFDYPQQYVRLSSRADFIMSGKRQSQFKDLADTLLDEIGEEKDETAKRR